MRVRDIQKERTIRDKALEIIVKQGLDGFSMQKLAKEANVSPATIYIYFKDKEALVEELCREASEKMMQTTFEQFDPAMNFREGLRSQWRNRAKYCLENPAQMQFLEQLRHSPMGDKLNETTVQAFKKMMGEFVSNAISNNQLIPLPVEVYWSVAFAPLYNLLKFHQSGKSLSGKQFVLTEAVMNQTLELVIKALTP